MPILFSLHKIEMERVWNLSDHWSRERKRNSIIAPKYFMCKFKIVFLRESSL